LKAFYYHWYRHYTPLQTKCPVQFSPHDLRHLFVTEFLIRLKLKCGLGKEFFDSDKYLSEREAFGRMVMGWRSTQTIDIYDQSRDGEAVFSTLAEYQKDVSQRHYGVDLPIVAKLSDQSDTLAASKQQGLPLNQEAIIVWTHDEETLEWVKSMEKQSNQ